MEGLLSTGPTPSSCYQCSNRFGSKLNAWSLSINLPNTEESDQPDQSFKETNCLEIPFFSHTFSFKLLSQSDPTECQQTYVFWSGSQEEENEEWTLHCFQPALCFILCLNKIPCVICFQIPRDSKNRTFSIFWHSATEWINTKDISIEATSTNNYQKCKKELFSINLEFYYMEENCAFMLTNTNNDSLNVITFQT